MDVSDACDEFALGFLEEGNAANEKTFVFGPAASLDRWSITSAATVAVDPYAAFLDGGARAPQALYDVFRAQDEQARAEGFHGVRIFADMDWTLPLRSDEGALASFELLLDRVVGDLGAATVCAYRSASFSGDAARSLGSVHPLWLGQPDARPEFRVWAMSEGRWAVAGDIDATETERFRVSLLTLTRSAPAVRLDLSGLRFIDLAGMRAFAEVASSTQVRFTLAGSRPTFRRCWSMLGYDRTLPSVELV